MHETGEIGRQNAFPRGWLENESVFLHMEYKYFLELLRAGLYEEFFHHFRHSMIPFLDPSVYGRSIFENSTFLASSSHPDPKVHGQGFVSRLTGACAEFLSMWLFMTAGQAPFGLDGVGGLTLAFRPVLPGWLFTETVRTADYFDETGGFHQIEIPAGSFAFRFLGHTLVVYHNECRRDTFGPDGVKIVRMLLAAPGGTVELAGSVIGIPYSQEIRDGKFSRIDIYLK